MKGLIRGAGILSYFTRHRTAANLLLVLMLAAGLSVLPNMRAQFFPDVVVDDINVTVAWDGAGAAEIDSGIVQVLGPVLLAVDGVAETKSTSREGRASINVEFEPGWDIDQGERDIERAVDTVTNLPSDAEDPVIRRGQWRDRVTDIVLTGPVGVDQLARFADELVIRLRQGGVTKTTIRGVAAPSITVEVSSLSLIRHDVTMAQIANAIAAEADTNPAGDVTNSARVRTGSEKRSVEDILDIAIRSNPDGSRLRIGDVAQIFEGSVDRNRAYFVGDDPALTIRVDRSPQGDAIEIQAQVERIAAEMELTLPEGSSVELIRGRSEVISGRLNILLDNGLMGLGLVVVLLFLFLNARTAFWVAAGIPVAMLAAIALMYIGGLTINMISLFALIITLGIVVDDAIVVGEHADARFRKYGEPPVVAAENAARRMFQPVLSATITTIIAFFGLVAIGGRFGDLIADIPFTVIAVLIASLIECFLILPNHMSHSIASGERWYDWPSRQVNRGFDWLRDRLFRPLIRLVIIARYPLIATMVLALSMQVAQLIRGDVPWRFFNAPEQGSVTGNFAMLPGATRDDTLEMMRELQRATDALAAEYEAEHGTNPIDYVIAEVGGNSGRALAGSSTKDADQLGSIAIELIDADQRPYSSFAFVAELQDSVQRHPMVETISFRSWGSGPGGDDIEVQMFGATPDVLKQAAEALKSELSQFPEVTGVEDSLAYDKEELTLDLTPQGQALGFTIEDVGRVLRHRLVGIEAATYPVGARSATIRVELPAGELTADFLDRTQLRSPSGIYVPLADLVTMRSQTGFAVINREDSILLLSVTGDLTDDDADRAAAISAQITDEILPRIEQQFGIETRLSGLAEQENQFLNDARNGAILSLLGIFLTLAWVFSSWTRPLVVMAIIPFGLVGTIWGHGQWGVPLSMFSIVGLIGMIGIIINDSIVLVTSIDEHARERGLFPAIVDGTADRLRPVMLTTLTTVLGLAPLLYEGSSQAEFLKPTVITLTYGLGFGMVIVLFLVPALMAVQRDVSRLITSTRRAFLARASLARLVSGIALIGAGIGFAALFGPFLSGGTIWSPLAGIVSVFGTGTWAIFAAYLAVLAVWLVLVYGVSFWLVLRGRGQPQP